MKTTTSFGGRSARGFALLEVLLALALFASTATALAMALHRMAEYSRQSWSESLLLRRLESALTETCAVKPLKPGRTRFPADEAGVSLIIEVTPEPLRNQKGGTLDGLHRVAVTARLEHPPVERRLERLVHSPVERPPAR